MRYETLCKRLSEKTSTPALEKVLLEGGSISDLPDGCMLWSGAMDGQFEGVRIRRMGFFPQAVKATPQPIIRYEGKKVSVRRLIFEKIVKPDYEYRLRQQCPNPQCVNPVHVEVLKIEPPKELEELLESDWTQADVDELVEILLTEQRPNSWEEVIQSPLLEGAPEDFIRETLTNLQKDYLL